MVVLSFAAMYVLMYAMVDVFDNVYSNLNQVYMAGLMTGAMVVIEMLVMGSMYSRKVKRAAIIGGIIASILFYFLIRGQIGISDEGFLRSMIPHHASALLMCQKANLSDPEVKKLCQDILSSQKEQIDWMKAKLGSQK